nr:VOC family protein [uncultured Ligilactobacillus sp.]
MRVRRLDHIVLTVSNIEKATRFYHEVFDMPVINDQTDENVTTLRCGHQLIRLQKSDRPTELKAEHPTIGAADFCIVVGDDIESVENHLKSYFVNIVAGPIEKMGSEGKMTSIYITDNDQNLIEISSYK